MARTPGPPPTPTKLKLLRGSKKKMNENEPHPDLCIPEMPDFLSEEAQEEWDYITPLLAEVGLIAEVDKAAISAYCQAYGRWSKVEAILNRGGVVYQKKALNRETGQMEPSGELLVNPLLWVANRAMEQMRQFLTEFGMTPSSRSRVAMQKHENLKNAYETWKNRPD